MKHFCFAFDFRIVDGLLAELPRHSSILRCSLLGLHVGVRGGVLHNPRFLAACVLPHRSVLLHIGIHSSTRLMSVDALVLGLLEGSRALYASAVDKWLVSSPRRRIRCLLSYSLRLLWRFTRLDAKLGAQQHGLVVCACLSRLSHALPGWNPLSCRGETFEVQEIERDRQSRSRLLDGRQTEVRRAHRHLKHSTNLYDHSVISSNMPYQNLS